MSIYTASQQKAAVTAMMLGDAFVDVNEVSGKARLDIYQNSKNLDFLEWKQEILNDITGISCSIVEKVDNRVLESGSVRQGYRLQTNFSTYFYKLHTSAFKYKAKRAMTPLGLAILWMDDGTLVMRAKRTGRAKIVLDPSDRSQFSTANLCTDSWSFEEVNYFRKIWNNKLGWCPEVQDYTCRGAVYPRLRLRKDMAIKLSEYIDDFVVDSMRYKLLFNTL